MLLALIREAASHSDATPPFRGKGGRPSLAEAPLASRNLASGFTHGALKGTGGESDEEEENEDDEEDADTNARDGDAAADDAAM